MKKNKVISIITISVVFLLINISLINSSYGMNAAPIFRKKIYVDSTNTNGPWNGTQDYPYQHINDAVENSTPGDYIFVFNGIYNENIVVDKSLSIIGENKNKTIIDGMYNDFVILINNSNVNICNFSIRNSGGYMDNAGIKIDSDNNQITQCIFYRTKTGIYVNKTSNNQIIDCIFHTNGEGIYLKSAKESGVFNCYFTHNGIGLNIINSNNIEIHGCYAETNGLAVNIDNSFEVEVLNCAIFNNNDNQGGFSINNSGIIIIDNCNIVHNGFGVIIDNSLDIELTNSSVLLNTHYGIYLNKNSEKVEILNSEIAKNLRFGLYIEKSSCKLLENNLHDSLFGVFLEFSFSDARKNWWGSIFGPGLFDRETRDRIFMKFSRLLFFPWLIKKVEEAGANWEIDYNRYNLEINNSRYKEIELQGVDSDYDLIPDWWEEKWGYNAFLWDDHKQLDPDGDGLNNIEECYTDDWDSNPFKKDIFMEFDWIKAQKQGVTNKPSLSWINKMKYIFENHNITLHIDDGSLGGGEEIIFKSRFSHKEVRDLYWEYFLDNDLNNPRKGIFHYALICDYGNEKGYAFIGWNHLDSFICPAQFLVERSQLFSRDRYIIGGSIHELGHSLGLTVDDYGGNDNKVATMPLTKQWWKYTNYKSCMNYRYTYKIIDFSDGSHGVGDFDDWNNFDFSFFKNTHFILA
jgi:parallel beta-helix repeat protein